eukprot:jgi/Bigna1/125941/aug1.1_g649
MLGLVFTLYKTRMTFLKAPEKYWLELAKECRSRLRATTDDHTMTLQVLLLADETMAQITLGRAKESDEASARLLADLEARYGQTETVVKLKATQAFMKGDRLRGLQLLAGLVQSAMDFNIFLNLVEAQPLGEGPDFMLRPSTQVV